MKNTFFFTFFTAFSLFAIACSKAKEDPTNLENATIYAKLNDRNIELDASVAHYNKDTAIFIQFRYLTPVRKNPRFELYIDNIPAVPGTYEVLPLSADNDTMIRSHLSTLDIDHALDEYNILPPAQFTIDTINTYYHFIGGSFKLTYVFQPFFTVPKQDSFADTIHLNSERFFMPLLERN
ncbi:MAG: hypothetical protein WCR52_08715 [Bacteroidota bacterium]|uniref:hypothetical protein n=1 Tax=Runella sp. TaxID=1960881 RepID=UPI00301A8D2A